MRGAKPLFLFILGIDDRASILGGQHVVDLLKYPAEGMGRVVTAEGGNFVYGELSGKQQPGRQGHALLLQQRGKALAAVELDESIYGGQFASEIGDERYREYRAISPLKGPEGVQYAMSMLQLPGIGGFAVTSACEDPALALEWADYFYTSEVTASMYNGVEGVGWRWAEEGEIGFNGEPAQWAAVTAYSGNTGDTQNYCWTQIGIYNFSEEWRGSQAVAEDTDLYSADGMEYMLYKVTQEQYEPYSGLQYCLPTLTYDQDTQIRISALEYEFTNYFNDVIFQFTTGEKDPNSDDAWNEHLSEMENHGVSEMCEIYQKAYDAMYK